MRVSPLRWTGRASPPEVGGVQRRANTSAIGVPAGAGRPGGSLELRSGTRIATQDLMTPLPHRIERKPPMKTPNLHDAVDGIRLPLSGLDAPLSSVGDASMPVAFMRRTGAGRRDDGRRGFVRGNPLVAAAAAGMLDMLLARLSR